MAHQERLNHWREQRRLVEKNLAQASPWLRSVFQTDILLIEGFIAYHEVRLSMARNKRR